MKVLPFKIPKAANYALLYQEDHGAQFYDRFHQHEEIQLSFIVSGRGDLIVGDTVGSYAENDIFILGGHMPHLFRSDPSYEGTSRMLSLFFTKDSFGKVFFDLSELRELEDLFRLIESGVRVETGKAELRDLFLELQTATHLERLILFLTLLKHIGNAETKPLASFIYSKQYSENEGKRMSDVLNHTVSFFNREITLSEIADVANLTPNAFCRYFKLRTNKTYFAFLLEIRLEHACRLLQQPDLSIAAISESSGFKNLSHFNRKFRQYTGTTPSKFRTRR